MHNGYIFQLGVAFLISLLFSILLAMFYLSIKRSADIQQDLATTDPLTKIANRNKLNLVMSTSIHTALRYDLPLSVIFFDIDHFKKINDKLGHDTGDDILVELSDLVSNQIRLSDLLARWGGEEFMIVLPETDSIQATILAEKLRALIDDRFFGVSIHVTCSFGVTQLHKDDDEHTLFKRVDVALYSAKERGRNRVITIE
jgi:polar amino acid transport system substrate-binding protein